MTEYKGAYSLSNDPIGKKEADDRFLTLAEGAAAYAALSHAHTEYAELVDAPAAANSTGTA